MPSQETSSHHTAPLRNAVLKVRDLSVAFASRGGALTAVDGVSFNLAAGEVMGIVGESGSGKSVTGLALMGLIGWPGRLTGGSVMLEGEELIGMPESELRRIRGRRMAMILQDPTSTLNPVLRIDTQMIEAIRAHDTVSERAARERVCEMLSRVGIPSPRERMLNYPHQFSGGMRQRIAIAIALLHRPAVLIADEATTALDVSIQAQILAEVQSLAEEAGTAMIWITHDLSVVAGLADRIAVMYAGRLVETGRVDQLLEAPAHPYTAGLIACVPSHNIPGTEVAQIPGSTPSLARLKAGCAFAPRCRRSTAVCGQVPPLVSWGEASERSIRCFHPVIDIGARS
ncbi:ABC transporter ATP-binding protein [Aquamicrobium sp. LC103]|uniref:ABC transporter ATP-binding protein n=1 Tax=Aquamicrobium sp. LC103 TaxID=1120658 RepID=UPI00063EB48A|nr:ABC transporter ATP-binding protein [Aquamicrobium sp. LC103]